MNVYELARALTKLCNQGLGDEPVRLRAINRHDYLDGGHYDFVEEARAREVIMQDDGDVVIEGIDYIQTLRKSKWGI